MYTYGVQRELATVVKALEKIIPHYDEVNRYLSLGYAEKAKIRLYMHILTPIFAKVLIRRKIKGNPWCLLAPTHKEPPTNKSLRCHLREAFGSASMREFLFGAIVVLRGLESQRG